MNTNLKSPSEIKRVKILIKIASVAIPLVVAILFGVQLKGIETFKNLPPVYATINGLTAVLLILALMAIKSGKRKLHQQLINTCMILSLLFLLCYVLYHMTNASTAFGGLGIIKYVYYFILISHILLSVIVVPLVLYTYLFAWQGNFEKHKKWTRITFPIWLYVAITGVVVYLMISPFYK